MYSYGNRAQQTHSPSISTSIWFNVFSCSLWPPRWPRPRFLPMASISSMNKIQGACFRAIANMSRTWKRNPDPILLFTFLSHAQPSLDTAAPLSDGGTQGCPNQSHTEPHGATRSHTKLREMTDPGQEVCWRPPELTTHPCWPNTNKHFQELRPIHSDEGHIGLPGSCFCKKCFASTRWTSEHGSLQ